jgi:hypothetical protein
MRLVELLTHKYNMRFKNWLEDAGTSMTYGGATIPALIGTNSNMPVRSKYVAMDGGGSEKKLPSPDKSFGFKTLKQKKQATESQPNIIDKGRKAIPMRDDDLGITY